MPRFEEPKINQENLNEGLEYPTENEAGFDGLASGENPDSNNNEEPSIEENVLHFRKINEFEKKWLEGERDIGTFKHLTKYLDRENFDVIFLTQSSSIPYGIIFKEAYKTAFPDKKQPLFLTVNPKGVRALQKDWEWRKRIYHEYALETGHPEPEIESMEKFGVWPNETDDLKKFINTKIQENPFVLKTKEEIEESCKKYLKDGDKILVFDEMGFGMSAKIAQDFIEEAAKNLNKSIEIKKVEKLELGDYRGTGPFVSKSASRVFSVVTYENDKNYQLYEGQRVIRPRNRMEREIVLENIKYFKKIGRDAGEQVKEGLKKSSK
ncbi:MAG: hypothetical protein Q7K65_00050 [Candidatus Buchananbacteria bacterium]|nr:hypothetical protein [Candidatus Buchananbacteria bacterium]